MRIVAGLCVAWLLALGTAQAQTCGLEQIASIDMAVTPRRLTVPVSFGNAHRDLTLLLDQAGNQITAQAAKELDFKLTAMSDNIHIHRKGGEVTYMAKAPEFALGNLRTQNVDFLMLPPDAERVGVVGDLGTHIFEKLDVELDMAGGKLNLFSPDHCPGKVVHWTQTGFVQMPLVIQKMGYIRVEMQLDGKPVQLGLNTAGTSSIGMNAMRRIFGVDETAPDMKPMEDAPDGAKLYHYPFKTLQAGGLNIANPAILVRGEAPSDIPCDGKSHTVLDKHRGGFTNKLLYEKTCLGGEDGVLGLSVLSKLHLYFSKKEGLLYLTAAGAH